MPLICSQFPLVSLETEKGASCLSDAVPFCRGLRLLAERIETLNACVPSRQGEHELLCQVYLVRRVGEEHYVVVSRCASMEFAPSLVLL